MYAREGGESDFSVEVLGGVGSSRTEGSLASFAGGGSLAPIRRYDRGYARSTGHALADHDQRRYRAYVDTDRPWTRKKSDFSLSRS